MKQIKTRPANSYAFGLIIVLLLSIPAFYNLLRPGFPLSHDGELHVVRIWQMYKGLKDGQIPVRWADTVSYGLGSPIFVVNFQLPYYLGAILYFLGFTLADSFKLQLIATVVLAGVSSYIFFNKLFGISAAIVGSIIYTFAPYRFANIYTRGAIGEAWIFVFLPLLFLIIYKFHKPNLKTILIGSLIWTAMILSHTTIIIFIAPFILFFAVWLTLAEKKQSIIFYTLLVFGYGFLLSSFGFLPALFERIYLKFDTVYSNIFLGHFLPLFQLLRIPQKNINIGTPFQIGIGNSLIIILGFFAFLILRKRKNKLVSYLTFSLISVVFSFIFLTKVSLPIWQNIPLFRFILYPWRFLILIVFFSSMIGAAVIKAFPKYNLILVPFLIFLAIFPSRHYPRPEGYYQIDDHYFQNYQGSTTIQGEFTPLGLSENIYQYTQPKIGILEGQATFKSLQEKSGKITFTAFVESENALFKVGQLYFPGWKLIIDEKETLINPVVLINEGGKSTVLKGLITFYLEQGSHQVKLQFKKTPLRLLADLISLISFLVWVVVFIFSRKLSG